MKNAGFRLAILGLIGGVLIGLWIQAERYAARALLGALDEELRSAVPCQLLYDSASISFLSLTGEATNARVMCADQPKLQFERIEADFSLRKVWHRHVDLTELRLIRGHSRGVGVESETYKFIDYLAAPIPPELDRPDRWRIELLALKVIDSSFVEEFSSSRLLADGVGLSLHRLPNDDVLLAPHIDRVIYRASSGQNRNQFEDIILGGLRGEVVLKDDQNLFPRLTLSLGNAWTSLTGMSSKALGNALTGEGAHSISLPYLGLPEWLNITLDASSKISGSLESPILSGPFSAPMNTPARISPGGKEILNLDSFEGEFKVDSNHRQPIVTISRLTGSGATGSAELKSPIRIEDDQISGSVLVTTETIDLGTVRFENVSSLVTLSGPIDRIKASFAGELDALYLLDAWIPRWSFRAIIEDDTATLEANHDLAGASARVEGAISLREKDPVMNELRFSFAGLSPTSMLFREDGAFALSGSGSIRGPFDPSGIAATASLSLSRVGSPDPSALQQQLTIKEGLLTIKGESRDTTLASSLVMNIGDLSKPSTFSLIGSRLPLSHWIPALECGESTFTLDYRFPGASYLSADGSLSLKDLQWGCGDYELKLENSQRLDISGGFLQIPRLSLDTLDNRLLVTGTISLAEGYNLKASGQIPLVALASFLPAFDDVSGTFRATSSITGRLGAPQFAGSAIIENGYLSGESFGLLAEGINGSLSLERDQIRIVSLSGRVNSGEIELGGAFHLSAPEESQLSLRFQDVVYQPTEDLSTSLSGALSLTRGSSQLPSIRGAISLDSGEFQRNLDILNIVKLLTRLLFGSGEAKSELSTLPAIELDVGISAPRDLLILTNLLAAELKADIRVRGTLANPSLSGEMEVLNGWFGLNDRRFDITSGTITFLPTSLEPTLNVIAETTLRPLTGERVNVILSARGPLSSPTIDLASDAGLSQQRILNLLAEGGGGGEGTRANDLLLRSDRSQGYSLFEDIPLLKYSGFIRALTKVDSLVIEPRYSIVTGAVEPLLSARKSLFGNLSLIGESFIGTSANETRAGVVYDVTDNFNVLGYASTFADGNTLSLGIDATYTVLSSQTRYLDIIVKGNSTLSKRAILQRLRVTPSSQIDPSLVPSLNEKLRKVYRAEGYFRATHSVECSEATTHCRKLLLTIDEGRPTEVRSIRYLGDPINQVLPPNSLPKLPSRAHATQLLGREIRTTITRALRSEGYIRARVSARYARTETPGVSDLVIETTLGAPVSFTFSGNTIFSAEDFLETINLFTRKLPFGNNTINILLRNIDQKYREAGFLSSTIAYSKQVDPVSGREYFSISIDEGRKTEISRVELEGGEGLPRERLRTLVKERGEAALRALFSPEFVIDEEIRRNEIMLGGIYARAGFPRASISHHVTLSDDASTAVLTYRIIENDAELFDRILIEGIDSLSIPSPPPTPVSLSQGRDYLSLILASAKDEGYRQARGNISAHETSKDLKMSFILGPMTTIGKISIEGLVAVDEAVVRERLTIAPHVPWRSADLQSSKLALLRLGLFSKIELLPTDGTLDEASEDLEIRVTEKPLRTIELGGGYDSSLGVHVFGEATERALFADGRSLSFRLDSYFDSVADSGISRGVASLRYTDPSPWGSPWTLTEDARLQKLERTNQEFDLFRASLASYLFRSWEDRLSLRAGYTILEEELSNVSAGAILSELDEGNVRLGFLSSTVTWDDRDSPLNPTSGYSLTGTLRISDGALWSEASYLQSEARASMLLPLSEGLTLGVSSRGGASWTFGNTDQVPISQRFYLGGRNSVRGFKENSLGPRGPDSAVIGGDLLFANAIELQTRATDAMSLHLFFDSGNVFLRDIDTNGVRSSVGAGFRYLSPIGPIGFDLGFPVNRESYEDAWRLHFNIGSTF